MKPFDPLSETTTAACRLEPRRALVWGLFLFSGSCGLIYEVLWCRLLGLIFGNTVESLSAVLAAFMAGLALGSYVAGRLCHRLKRPLFVYGLLEASLGIYCALLPWVLSDHGPLVPLYRALYGETGSASVVVARFAISFGLLLIPATFMGATLPVLSQYLVRSSRSLGRTVGALYAVNSFGAVVGAMATGFALLPLLGKLETNWFAVGCNLLLGTVAMLAGRRPVAAAVPETATVPESAAVTAAAPAGPSAPLPAMPEESLSPLAVRVTIFSFGLTGFAAMATQIGWTRAISLGTGSSTYAFSLIVAVFILGLSLGGSWGARIAGRTADPVALLSRVLLLTGLFCVTLAALLGLGPILFFLLLVWAGGGSGEGNWPLILGLQAAGIGLLIIGPTFLMGATMPLTLQVASRSHVHAGRTVGAVYAVNTVGAILGSLLGGLVLLPFLQIQNTLELMALLYALPGAVLFCLSATCRKRELRGSTFLLLALLLTAFVFRGQTRWDPRVMSSGSYLLRNAAAVTAVRQGRLGEALPAGREILYYREGAASTVAVALAGGALALSVGGKPDASSQGDMTTQVGLTLVPELLHEGAPEEVLVIGLGSGVSAGAALARTGVKRVDVVEMSPEVVKASWYFRPWNKLTYAGHEPSWLATPRVQVLVNDGRNHLLLTSRKYDVIASEPSNPWMAGVGNLFTKEAFTLARERLKPGGIMCQWVHSYSLEEQDFFSIAKTFGEVFPHVQLWWINRGDYLLLGSQSPLRVPLQALRERQQEPQVRPWLARIHMDTAEEFLANFLAADELLRRHAAPARVHTDDNMLLEFSAPRALYACSEGFRSSQCHPAPENVVGLEGLAPEDQAVFLSSLDLAVAAREHTRLTAGMPADSALYARQMATAWRLAPHQFWAAEFHAEHPKAGLVETPRAPLAPNVFTSALATAKALLEKGGEDGAFDLTGEVLRDPETRRNKLAAPLWAFRAELLERRQQPVEALATVELASRLAPLEPLYAAQRARYLADGGRLSDALDCLLWRQRLDPGNAAGLREAAQFLFQTVDLTKCSDPSTPNLLRLARRMSREACALEPDNSQNWELLCRICLLLKNCEGEAAAVYQCLGAQAYREALRCDNNDMTKLPVEWAKIFAR